jgi:hypothetical protein
MKEGRRKKLALAITGIYNTIQGHDWEDNIISSSHFQKVTHKADSNESPDVHSTKVLK